MSQTKIVATIGPSTETREAICTLVGAGMSVARLNGSHADLEWHDKAIATIRDAAPEVPILFDIPGRKIRTTQLANEPSFERGDTITLTTETSHDGSEKVPVNYPTLHEDLRPGATILADDGMLRFTVLDVRGTDIICRAETAGTLRSRKGINVPFVKLRTPMVTDRDRDMVAFCRDHEIDFIGISFVESGAHVEAIRELTGGSWPRIVAKVENQGGLDNLEEIVLASDAIMIDRGDLSVETNLEQLTLFQKHILEVAQRVGKPAIVATEMLHTMIENPFPTKAEVGDITNAVLDGCAATMLSGETAIGVNAEAAVAVMRRVADVAAAHLQDRLDVGNWSPTGGGVPEAMGEAAAVICRALPVTKIVVVTISGYAARMVAVRRPRQPILAVSNDPMAARSFNLLPGTEGLCVEIPFTRTSTDHIAQCLEGLWRRSKLEADDMILVISVGYPRSGSRMNLLQTHTVADLIESLSWGTRS